MDYATFIESKRPTVTPTGLATVPALHPKLFPFQRDIVAWALRLGRAAIFAECGLGKTFMQLEWARHVPGRVLVVAPLAVSAQTVEEGLAFGVAVNYARSQSEVAPGITITNYEMIEEFDASKFTGVVLDESSILKNYTGATKRKLLQMFAKTPYRLACTATPAPNDHLELGNHAEFLGVMPSNEMISRWFINDTMSAGSYRLKGHARRDFWDWVASWAVCVGAPSDIGHSDDGFVLPPLNIERHMLRVDHGARGDKGGEMFAGGGISATGLWREKRATMHERAKIVADIVATKPGAPWTVWCDTNDEADAIMALLPEAVEVRGSHTMERKLEALQGFAKGAHRIMVTKADIAGLGLNWQHCADVVFAGLTYSFEAFYQALRRSWRFRQTKPVTAHVVFADSEGNVIGTIKEKQQAHDDMRAEMKEAMRRNGVGVTKDNALKAVEEDLATGTGFALHLGDSCQTIQRVESASVDFSVYSPPFANLYIYSDSIADMGNSADHDEFFKHYSYLIRELHRVTKPGRLSAVHCKDLPLYKNRDGAAGLIDFPGQIIAEHEKAGWTFHSRVTIWKDPVIEMQRTKNHGLLHKNFTERAEACRQGMADYLIVFRKWADDMPDGQVKQRRKFGDYVGESAPLGERDERGYSIAVWQRYASPVWFDIQQTDVLNIQAARDNQDEKHICPLQLGVIRRAIDLWTNPGDTVLSPFAGIGSEGYVALDMGRKFVGVELKRSYWEQARRNLEAISKAGKKLFE